MKRNRVTVLSAFASALLLLGGEAQATERCSSETLRGAYAFSAAGEILGIVDGSGTVHPFENPSILNDVAILSFDGVGHFQRTDSGISTASPREAISTRCKAATTR